MPSRFEITYLADDMRKRRIVESYFARAGDRWSHPQREILARHDVTAAELRAIVDDSGRLALPGHACLCGRPCLARTRVEADDALRRGWWTCPDCVSALAAVDVTAITRFPVYGRHDHEGKQELVINRRGELRVKPNGRVRRPPADLLLLAAFAEVLSWTGASALSTLSIFEREHDRYYRFRERAYPDDPNLVTSAVSAGLQRLAAAGALLSLTSCGIAAADHLGGWVLTPLGADAVEAMRERFYVTHPFSRAHTYNRTTAPPVFEYAPSLLEVLTAGDITALHEAAAVDVLGRAWCPDYTSPIGADARLLDLGLIERRHAISSDLFEITAAGRAVSVAVYDENAPTPEALRPAIQRVVAGRDLTERGVTHKTCQRLNRVIAEHALDDRDRLGLTVEAVVHLRFDLNRKILSKGMEQHAYALMRPDAPLYDPQWRLVPLLDPNARPANVEGRDLAFAERARQLVDLCVVQGLGRLQVSQVLSETPARVDVAAPVLPQGDLPALSFDEVHAAVAEDGFTLDAACAAAAIMRLAAQIPPDAAFPSDAEITRAITMAISVIDDDPALLSLRAGAAYGEMRARGWVDADLRVRSILAGHALRLDAVRPIPSSEAELDALTYAGEGPLTDAEIREAGLARMPALQVAVAAGDAMSYARHASAMLTLERPRGARVPARFDRDAWLDFYARRSA